MQHPWPVSAAQNDSLNMGRRSKIESLPASVRRETDRRLIQGGFSGYERLAANLRERGYRAISKSSLHRYGTKIRDRLETAQARAQLELAGIDGDIGAGIACDLARAGSLVVVIDRRNGRAKLFEVPASASAVAAHLARLAKG